MCQEVLDIRYTVVKQDIQSPNSHGTYIWREMEVRETDNKHVGSKIKEQIFQIVISAMKQREDGHGIRCPG